MSVASSFLEKLKQERLDSYWKSQKIIKNNDYQNSIKDNVNRALEELSLSESSSVIAAQTVIKVLNNER